jgi:cytochrome c
MSRAGELMSYRTMALGNGTSVPVIFRRLQDLPSAVAAFSKTGDRMNALFITLAAAPLFAAGAAHAALDNAAAEAMMKKDGCAACHSIDKKIVGPAYVDVAAKYKGDKDAAVKLAKKVKDGGSGVWGAIPMPPNATTSQADIDALVAWILTLKK